MPSGKESVLMLASIICYSSLSYSQPIFPANQANAANWNVRIDLLPNSCGANLFNQLFDDITAPINIEILASYSTSSESPLFVDSLNSILFTSPQDGNLYRYNLGTSETTLFIENAGEFGGIYDGDIPRDDCLECGPNGLSMGLKGIEDYVIMAQHALNRVIAFDPSDPTNEDTIIVIADNVNGVRLNSPNDITIAPDGKSMYFTDPTFGLQAAGDTKFSDSFDKSKLGFQGVYKVKSKDVSKGDTEPRLVASDMVGPNGIAVTNDGRYLIVANTANRDGWAPFYNVYSIKGKKSKGFYILRKRIVFDMGQFAWNGFAIPFPLADGMEIYSDDILLAVCPGGICLIDLYEFEIVGRISIDHLISNIHIHDGWIYVTSQDNLFRIELTAAV